MKVHFVHVNNLLNKMQSSETNLFILDISSMHRIACFLPNTELVIAEAQNPFLDKWVLYEENQS